MKKIPNHSSTLRQRLGRLMAGAALLTLPAAAQAQLSTWTGGATSNYWSAAANWGGTAITSGNAVTFSGTTKTINTNDVTGLNLGAVILTNSAWNLQGDAVNLTSGSFTATVAGTTTWGLPTVLNTTPSIIQAATGDLLNFTGYLSGTGGITKTAGSTGQGAVYLSDTTNSFTGNVTVNSGILYYYSLALGGQPSSLGAGTGAIAVGYKSTSYGASMVYLGSGNGVTDRAFNFADLTTTTVTFSNNSPANASLSYVSTTPFTLTDNTVGDVFQLTLSGTSTGTNFFATQFGTTLWGGNLLVAGPGVFVFSNVFNFTNTVTLASTSHMVLLYNAAIGLPNAEFPAVANLIVNPSATLDVTSYDTNNVPFELGSAETGGLDFPQTLTIGRTNGAATDLNGSLSLNGPYGATLVVAGIGRAGNLTISSNFITGSGTIKMDLGTNTTTGSGSNDVILVGGNLDLSQGAAVIVPNLTKGALNTNTAYTLISYGGTLIGDASGLSVPAPSRSYNPGVVSTAIPGLVQVTFGPSGSANANLFWSGNDGPNWDLQTTPNWLNNGSGDYFYAGDFVNFNDNANQFAINLVGSLSPGAITVSNNINTYSFSAPGGGTITSGSLLKQGVGQLTVNGANTYSGGTVISAGTIMASNTTPLGTGPITLGDANTGTNEVTLAMGVGATWANAVNNNTTNGVIAWTGTAATLNGPLVLAADLTFNTFTNANVNNFLFQGGITGTGNVTVMGGGGIKWQTGATAFSGNVSVMGTNTYWDVNSTLNTNVNVYLGPGTIYGDVSSAKFNVLSGSGDCQAGTGAAYEPTMYIGAGNGSGTYSGQIINNNVSEPLFVIKTGSGTETFTGDNSLSAGGTTIGQGILAVNNPTGSGLCLGGFTVSSGAILCGNGTIEATSSNVFNVNGTLEAGNPGDTTGTNFTLNGTGGLFFGSGGSLSVGIYSGAGAGDNTGNPAAADTLNAQCPVAITTNTTLTILNPNGLTAFAIGDKWKIANWQSMPTNTFAATNLPALGASLAWDTSQLYTAGVIDIVAATVSNPTKAASILGVTTANGSLIINGTNLNGGASFHYEVLSTTNLLLPLSNWTVISTNSFNADGTFNNTNPIDPAQAQQFYDVKAVQ